MIIYQKSSCTQQRQDLGHRTVYKCGVPGGPQSQNPIVHGKTCQYYRRLCALGWQRETYLVDSLSLWLLTMCVHVCMYAWNLYIYVHMYRNQRCDAKCLPQFLHIAFWGRVSLWTQSLSSELEAGQQAPRSSCLYLPNVGNTGMHHQGQILHRV